MKNKNNTADGKLIRIKIEEKTHSQSGFAKFVINNILDKYECLKPFPHYCTYIGAHYLSHF